MRRFNCAVSGDFNPAAAPTVGMVPDPERSSPLAAHSLDRRIPYDPVPSGNEAIGHHVFLGSHAPRGMRINTS